MLVGRDAELTRLLDLIASVREGGGGALVLRGNAGIGKTALLEAAAEAAGELTVLRARGVQAESSIPFAALRDLLAPLERATGTLPEPQQAALAGAIAAGPPVPGDRLAVLAATDGLLQAAAPVLALVDDAPWLDAPTLECLTFAARRSRGGVGWVFTAREPLPDLPELELAPLGPADAERLVSQLPDQMREEVLALAAGNPLALRHLPDSLAGRAGVFAGDVPPDPGRALDALFVPRIAALSEPARVALTVAAACADGDLRAIVPACEALGAGSLTDAEAAGLVTLDRQRLDFVHPLARAAAYHAGGPAQKRAAHGALAQTTHGPARAWHLAGAAVGPDEAAAAALEEAAGVAAAQRAYASASLALERAARLSGPPQLFARRLLAAADAALAAGRPELLAEQLDAVEAEVEDAGARAHAGHLRGLLRIGSGDVSGGVSLLEARAADCAETAPPLAAAMLADAAAGCTALGDCRRALAVSTRAAALLNGGGDPTTRVRVLAVHAWSLCLRGELRQARPLLDELEVIAAPYEPFSPAAPALLLALNAAIPLEQFERTLARSSVLAAQARDAGALFVLPSLLVAQADTAYRLGRWELVGPSCDEAIDVCDQIGQHGGADGHARVTRARLHAARGEVGQSLADVEAALALAAATRQVSGEIFARAARGFLWLGTGDVEAAIGDLETVERLCDECGFEEPTLVPWAPDLVEAYARAGRTADARRVTERLAAQVERSGSRWARDAAARCAGLAGVAVEPPAADALPLPFERARTLLAHGWALQRAGRRADARAPLREALDTFTALGAAPWAEQARGALRAAGGRRAARSSDALTPQELRVAQAAGAGASTKDIAAQLFLSPRTVESHLAQIYRKLGVHSRAALASHLVEDGGEILR